MKMKWNKNIVIILIIIIFMVGICVGWIMKNNINNSVIKSNSKSQNTKQTTQDNYIISSIDAIKIALKKVQINQEDIIYDKVHFEYDDGRQIYDVSFIYKDMEYDFEIDAQTGNVIEFSIESIYD